MEDEIYEGFNPAIEGAGGGGGLFGSQGLMAGNQGLGPMQVPNPSNPVVGPLRAPPSSLGRMMTGRMRTGQLGTAAAGAGGEPVRPMTSVKAAGYQSKPGTAGGGGRAFDPLGQQALGPAPPLAEKADDGPEAKAKEMEKRVNALIDASASAAHGGDPVMALERAKEAGKKERQLTRMLEQNGLSEQINMDLTYGVLFNLANSYAANGLFTEALNTYNLIVKNRHYPHSARLRVNMGNIHYTQRNFPQAIKQYRMAYDQIPASCQHVRLRILRNVGCAFVRMGQFQDAIQSFEQVMDAVDGEAPEDADYETGFNLVVCYFALGDTELMRRGFLRLLALEPPPTGEDEEEGEGPEEDDEAAAMAALGPRDELKEYLRARHRETTRYISNAAKLIAPALNPDDWTEGYDWVTEQLRHDYDQVASELQIVKALTYLKRKQFDRAIEDLKAFEKKDRNLKAMAANNLSFLYFLEGNLEQAFRYAELAVEHDRYNAKALVNLGNCLCEQGELERAKELFLEAIGVEADCIEAIFNLGLVNKQLGILSEALQAFEKLHTIVPAAPEVIYHIANLYDMLGEYGAAAKYFNYLLTKVPTDPAALARLGQIYHKSDEETQAFHFHQESFRFFPVNLDVISYLGIWFVKTETYSKAIEYFEQAAAVQPKEVKWHLMVASCYRRMRAFREALERYERIHREFPDNIECLSYLVALCRELNRPCGRYEEELIRLERQQAMANEQYEGAEEEAGVARGGGGAEESFGAGSASGGADWGGFGATSPGRERPMGSMDEPFAGAGGGGGFGSPDRFAAPAGEGPAATGAAAPSFGMQGEEDDFGDTDLSQLLVE